MKPRLASGNETHRNKLTVDLLRKATQPDGNNCVRVDQAWLGSD